MAGHRFEASVLALFSLTAPCPPPIPTPSIHRWWKIRHELHGKLKFLGPGLVLTASIVGSGELIATTSLGAKAGFTALWIILASCAVKVALQLQFGRHTILTGETCLTAFNRLPGSSWRGADWTIWCWLLIQPLKLMQMGGIIGGVAMIMHLVVPQVTHLCMVLDRRRGHRDDGQRRELPLHRAPVCVTLVGAFTATTLISGRLVAWTEYAVRE